MKKVEVSAHHTLLINAHGSPPSSVPLDKVAGADGHRTQPQSRPPPSCRMRSQAVGDKKERDEGEQNKQGERERGREGARGAGVSAAVGVTFVVTMQSISSSLMHASRLQQRLQGVHLNRLNPFGQQAAGFAKDVRFGVDSRSLVLAGCNKLADAVQVTLGPKVCHWHQKASGLSRRVFNNAAAR